MRERLTTPSENVIDLSTRRKDIPQGEQLPISGSLAKIIPIVNIVEVPIEEAEEQDPHKERIAYIRERMGHGSNSGAIRDAVEKYHDLLRVIDQGEQLVAISRDDKVREITFDPPKKRR